jgi:hypothetical protein
VNGTPERLQVVMATVTLVLLVLGLAGALFDITSLSTTCLMLFVVVGPGSATVQFFGDLDVGLMVGMCALTGLVFTLILGLVMVEFHLWHPLIALLLVAVPSTIGSAYGLRAAWLKKSAIS